MNKDKITQQEGHKIHTLDYINITQYNVKYKYPKIKYNLLARDYLRIQC